MKTPLILASLNEAKAYARTLRRELAAKGEYITHAKALERTAKQLGCKDWNTLSARLGPIQTFHPQVGDRLRGLYLKQEFLARLIGLREQNHGAHFYVTIKLDTAVDVVTFESFSALRSRLTATLDKQGRSLERTSDGEPHMIILETLSDVV